MPNISCNKYGININKENEIIVTSLYTTKIDMQRRIKGKEPEDKKDPGFEI